MKRKAALRLSDGSIATTLAADRQCQIAGGSIVGSFIEPVLRETAHSLLSRYHALYSPRAETVLVGMFFGQKAHVTTAMPKGLGQFFKSCPTALWRNFEEFLVQHSLLTYFLPFAAAPAALDPDNFRPNKTLSIGWHAESAVQRYCTDCVEYDQEKHGQPCWHIPHQAPGVLVCPQHHTVLQRYTPPPSRTMKVLYLPPIVREGGGGTKPMITVNAPLLEHAIALAHFIEGLMQMSLQPIGRDKLANMYRSAAAAQGFGAGSSLRLWDAVRQRYGSAGLELMGVSTAAVSGRPPNWMRHVFRGISAHPLYHYVIAEFLFGVPDAFAEACRAAGRAVSKPRKPPKASSLSEETILRLTTVTGWTIKKIAAATGLSRKDISIKLIKLGVTNPERKWRKARSLQEYQDDLSRYVKENRQVRLVWSKAPHHIRYVRNIVRSAAPEWLKQQLNGNSTMSATGTRSRRTVKSYDSNIATRLYAAAAEHVEQEGFPIKITRNSLLRRAKVKLSNIAASDLPLTERAFAALVDSKESYMRRKLAWALDQSVTLPTPLPVNAVIRLARCQKHGQLSRRILDELLDGASVIRLRESNDVLVVSDT